MKTLLVLVPDVLKISNTKKRRLRGNMVAILKYLNAYNVENGAILFSTAPEGMTAMGSNYKKGDFPQTLGRT